MSLPKPSHAELLALFSTIVSGGSVSTSSYCSFLNSILFSCFFGRESDPPISSTDFSRRVSETVVLREMSRSPRIPELLDTVASESLGRGGAGAVTKEILVLPDDDQTSLEVAVKRSTSSSYGSDSSGSSTEGELLALLLEKYTPGMHIMAGHGMGVALVMKKMDGSVCDLLTMLRANPTTISHDHRRLLAAKIISDGLAGLSEFYQITQHIHCDLKPGNLLFEKSGTFRLADYGLAKRPGMQGQSGTPGYFYPNPEGVLSVNHDLWGLFLTAIEFFSPTLAYLPKGNKMPFACISACGNALTELRSNPHITKENIQKSLIKVLDILGVPRDDNNRVDSKIVSLLMPLYSLIVLPIDDKTSLINDVKNCAQRQLDSLHENPRHIITSYLSAVIQFKETSAPLVDLSDEDNYSNGSGTFDYFKSIEFIPLDPKDRETKC